MLFGEVVIYGKLLVTYHRLPRVTYPLKLLLSGLYCQADRVFPLRTFDTAENAVSEFTQPMCYLPVTSQHPTCGLDTEDVSMATNNTIQHLVSQKDAEHVMTDIEVFMVVIILFWL